VQQQQHTAPIIESVARLPAASVERRTPRSFRVSPHTAPPSPRRQHALDPGPVSSARHRGQRVGVAGQKPTAVGLFAIDGDPMTGQLRCFSAGARCHAWRVPTQYAGDFADDHDLFQLADATEPTLLAGGREADQRPPSRRHRSPRAELGEARVGCRNPDSRILGAIHECRGNTSAHPAFNDSLKAPATRLTNAPPRP
jgi:hypothetical protein